MRPRNQPARDQLSAVLRRNPGARAADLAELLNVSVATLHRLLAESGSAVVTAGLARRARYAWRRELRGAPGPWPVYSIDTQGHASRCTQLHLVYPEGSNMPLPDPKLAQWPVPEEARDGWWQGLPYPLIDMRPQGYLGRQLAHAQQHALLVPSNPDAWSDDEVVHVLTHVGSDTSGNLIVGDLALQRWQAHKLASIDAQQVHSARAVPQAYARLAEEAVAKGVAGSSAGGEFPKFPALRDLAGSATPHVLVKFSGADGSAAVQRWSDLLVCEHLALEHAALLPGVRSAKSLLVQHAGRSFLEVERFDRHGLWGRSPLVSLATLDAALVGSASSHWPVVAARLQQAGYLALADVQSIEHLWWFGRLIANTDMHAGNLSFVPQPASSGIQASLVPAPAYDMLPMSYAPLRGGEVPVRQFEPSLPLPAERAVWLQACHVALQFWQTAALDPRISAAFRAIALANAQRLWHVAQIV
jgi:hypothetical protein